MKRQTVILYLCTIAGVGIVYFATDNLLLAFIILIIGLLVAFYFNKRLELEEAQTAVHQRDIEHIALVRAQLSEFERYRNQISQNYPQALVDAANNIYDVAHHILYEEDMDLKFIHQVGLYLPRLNKIMEAFLAKSADFTFKKQTEDFLMKTSTVFSQLLTASGSKDMKEAESLMRALEDTYTSHGHLKQNEGGNIL